MPSSSEIQRASYKKVKVDWEAHSVNVRFDNSASVGGGGGDGGGGGGDSEIQCGLTQSRDKAGG